MPKPWKELINLIWNKKIAPLMFGLWSKRSIGLFLSIILYTALPAQEDRDLLVSPDGRFLMRSDSTPFFYLGDTAWELFHRLDLREAEAYLEDRAAKGFTVIQAVILAEIDGLFIPNPQCERPLIGLDPSRPNEAYFAQVDAIVDKAEQLGLYMGLLPTWGDKVVKKWGVGPEIFTPAKAEDFGEFLGRRYEAKPVIWILGGDRPVETEEHAQIWTAMARGLRRGDGGRHLISYHPSGGQSSATWWHDADWLDFNMHQSGHGRRNLPNYELTRQTYQLDPPKPTMDAEPCYEDLPVAFWKYETDDMRGTLAPAQYNTLFREGWFGAYDVRKAAYWSVLAGACGHTYGNNNVWQMYEPGRKPNIYARSTWYEALDQPGAGQMLHLRRLFESRPFLQLRPQPDLLLDDTTRAGNKLMAAAAADGSYAMVYNPTGIPFFVSLDVLSGDIYQAWWFNPREGSHTEVGVVGDRGRRLFVAPTFGEGADWVLVLDEVGRSFPPPGAP